MFAECNPAQTSGAICKNTGARKRAVDDEVCDGRRLRIVEKNALEQPKLPLVCKQIIQDV